MTPFSQREAVQLVKSYADAVKRAEFAMESASLGNQESIRRLNDVKQLRDNLEEEIVSALLGVRA